MTGPSDEWVLFAVLRAEARALGRGLPPGTPLHRTGTGTARAADAASRHRSTSALAVAGIAGGLSAALRPGDLVVASEVRRDNAPWDTLPCPTAPMIAASLRRRGLTVHIGPVVTAARLPDAATRLRLACTGALAVDTESAALLADARGRPVACVRVIADLPPRPRLHPFALGRLATALRALPPAAPALVEWAAATTVRQVQLAEPRSFCAGVERAIAMVQRALDQHGPPVYVRRRIVHNAHVVAALGRRGAVFVDDLDEIPDGAPTVFSAHGVPPAVRATAARRGLPVIDATCPLVTKAHSAARRVAGRGDTVLLIGHAGHEETEGTLGEAPERITLVQSAQDAERVEVADPARVSYLVQTTLAMDEVSDVLEVLRRRFPGLTGPSTDDTCYAATNRQAALRAVAARSDVVLVLGSGRSANSRRLVEIALRGGTPAYLVEDVDAVDLRWLAGARAVGVTAGSAAPPRLVDETMAALAGLGPLAPGNRITTDDAGVTRGTETRAR